VSLALSVWQTRAFTRISKDVIFRIRRDLLLRLQRVSMAEYETLGSGTVASHLVTDLDAVDAFVGTATAKFVVAVGCGRGVWLGWTTCAMATGVGRAGVARTSSSVAGSAVFSSRADRVTAC
jgi:ABC-type multidrug transport system fused ATPase/permease subunit